MPGTHDYSTHKENVRGNPGNMGDNHPSQAENVQRYRGRKRRMRRSNDQSDSSSHGPEEDSKARISKRMNNPKGGY